HGPATQVALCLRLADRAPEPLFGQMQLVTNVDVGRVRPDAEAPDDAALDQRVRIQLHDGAIFEGTGLTFVGVDHQVVRLLRGFGHEAPLGAAIESGAASPPNVSLLHFFDDGLA